MGDPRGRVPKPDAAIVADFRGRMRSDPPGLVSSLRDSYNRRIPSAYDKDLHSLLDCFVEAYLDSDQSGIDMQQGLWKSFVAAGLPELYLEMVSAPDFFHEYPACVECILFGLSQMAILSENRAYAASRRALVKNASSIFKSLWEHRDLIPHSGMVIPGYDRIVYESILQLISSFTTLYESVGVAPVPPQTFIPHVGLCCWFNLDGSKMAEMGLYSLRVLRTYSTSLDDSTRLFIQEAGIEAYGTEALVGRLLKDTKNSSISWKDLGVVLTMLVRFTLHPTLTPLVRHYTLLHVFIDTVKRSQREASSIEAWEIWLACSLSLGHQIEIVHDELKKGPLKAPSTLSEEDVVGMLVCGIQQLVGKQDRSPLDLRSCQEHVQLLVNVVRRCKEKPAQHTNDLRRSLEKGARALWYPAFRLLRTEQQQRTVGFEKPSPVVIQAWVDFGAELGLKELRERDRYEREGLQHCAWKVCRYHIEKPENALLACRGCGEVRYCGRACQAKDWKEGEHKAKCRRLKN